MSTTTTEQRPSETTASLVPSQERQTRGSTTAPPATTSAESPAVTTSAVPVTPAPDPSATPGPPAESTPTNGKKIPYTGKPTENPNATLVQGKMRSDREELPEGWTREQADEAEMKEARLQKQARGLRAGLAPGCQLYWPSQFEVCGAIRDKYNSLGAQFSFLLLPTSPELRNPDGFGRRSHFQNGPIYWSTATGAHPVVNHFHQKWGQYGYEGGWLKYPTTDEIVLNGGRMQIFQGGSVYWSSLTGAHTVGGSIRTKWGQTGWEGGTLGYPTSDEVVLPDGQGRMNRFQRGVIYWHPTHGAHPVVSPVLDIWGIYGFEQSKFGYPTGDPQVSNGIPWQQFQFERMDILQPESINDENPPLYFDLDRTNVSEDKFDDEGLMRISVQWTQNSTDPDMVRPIAWGIKFLPPVYEIGSVGAATPTTCQGSITRNGASDPWSYSKLGTDGGTLDYLFHGTIPKNSFDEEIAMKMLCEFQGDFGRTMIADIRPYIMLRDRY